MKTTSSTLVFAFRIIISSNLIAASTVDNSSWRRTDDHDQTSKQNASDDDNCHRKLQEISTSNIVAKLPPHLTGIWTSKQCEVRPGPEYILRKYRFYEGGLFELHQYFYSDSHCHRPSFSLEARGRFKFYQASWIIPGATEVDYHLRYVTVMPYTTDMAADLSKQLNSTSCRVLQPASWLPFERHVVFHNVENDDNSPESPDYVGVDIVDCLSALDLSFHELQLVRVEDRYIGPEIVSRSLFLGDVHTDRRQRNLYRPTAYQEPLESIETTGCKVCRIVSKSSDYSPPQFVIRQRPPVSTLTGAWVSVRCETRPYGVFLIRTLRLLVNNSTWEATYQYFSDAICHQATFSVTSTGTYQLDHVTTREASYIPDDTHLILFETQTVKATVTDKRTLRQISNGKSCGSTKHWQLGKEQDLTSTLGCSDLGFKISLKEFDIIQLDQRQHHFLLYLGQRPMGDGKDSTLPTSFLPPLIRCSAADSNAGGPGKMAYTGENFNRSVGVTNNSLSLLTLIVCLTLLQSRHLL